VARFRDADSSDGGRFGDLGRLLDW